MQHTFLYISLPLFCMTTMPFFTTKTWNFLVTHFFVEELLYVLFLIAFSFFHCRSLPLPAGRREHFSFSHRRYQIFMFFFQRNSGISFVYNHSLQLFLCYPRDCRHQKYRRKRLDFIVGFYSLKDWLAIRFPTKNISSVCGADKRTGLRSRDYQNFLDEWITKFS